jgi:hypothetical protein
MKIDWLLGLTPTIMNLGVLTSKRYHKSNLKKTNANAS